MFLDFLFSKEQVPTIIVRWYLTESNGIAFVELKDDKIAKEAYNMLQTTLENVELSVDKKKSNQLIIKKLHKLKDDIYLKQMFSQYGFYPDKISVDRKELKEDVDFMETQVCIHSLFTPYKDFDYVDVFPSNNNDKSKKYGKAMANFKTMTGAVEAISNLNNTFLHVSFDLKESIIIPVAVYKHLEKDIDRVIIYIRNNFLCEVICKELSSSESTKKNNMLQVTMLMRT
ncbi:hypothetical protein ABK040_000946 [Willaertia magna]